MAGDVQLAALQIKAAPLDYVVPDSAVVRLKSVHGQFDGSGAGSDWLPAVELISDSGHTIALASDQGVSVAAGASADVSWFPGVKHSTTVTPPPPTAVGWGYGRFLSIDTGAMSSLATGTLRSVDFTGLTITTNDSTATGTHITTSSPYTGNHFSVDTSTNAFAVTVNSEGLYLVHRYFSILGLSGAPAAGFMMRIEVTGTVPPLHDWMLANENVEFNAFQAADGLASNYAVRGDQLFVVESGTTWSAGLSILQASGKTATSLFAGISLVWLGDQTV